MGRGKTRSHTILLLYVVLKRGVADLEAFLAFRMNPLSPQTILQSLHSEEIAAIQGSRGEGDCACESSHRQYVLCSLPRITTFDFSGVTKTDRTTAEVWKRMNIKPRKTHIKENAL